MKSYLSDHPDSGVSGPHVGLKNPRSQFNSAGSGHIKRLLCEKNVKFVGKNLRLFLMERVANIVLFVVLLIKIINVVLILLLFVKLLKNN